MICPVASAKSVIRRAGSAAEPLVKSRNARAPRAQRARSTGSAAAKVSISFAYIVGTAMNTVASAKRLQMPRASNGANVTAAPAHSPPSNATISPCV